jgi:hypothetical protein
MSLICVSYLNFLHSVDMYTESTRYTSTTLDTSIMDRVFFTKHSAHLVTLGTIYWVTVGKQFWSSLLSVPLAQHSIHNYYFTVCIHVPYILPCVTFLQHSGEIKLSVEKHLNQVFFSGHSFVRSLRATTLGT